MNVNNSFSGYNQKVLHAYGEKVGGRINNLAPQAPKSSFSLWGSITALLPSSKTTGEAVGYAAAATHGPSLSNKSIDFVCKRVFQAEKSQSWGGWFKSAVLGVARPSVAEMAKLSITPKLVPVLEIIGVGLGGLTAQGTIALISILYGRIMNDKNTKFTLDNLPSVENLLSQDKEGRIVDANGNEMTEEDLKDIKDTVLRYDTICKFLDTDKKTLDQLLEKFLFLRSDNWDIYYRDGNKVSEEDLKVIEEGCSLLKRSNPMEKTKAIRSMIKRLTAHVAQEPKEEVEKKYITCNDGTRCTKDGLVVSKEQYDAEVLKQNAEIEKTLQDFYLIDK